MNAKMIVYTLGKVLQVVGLLLLIPLLVALYYRESCAWALAATAAGMIAAGVGMAWRKPENRMIYAREGFLIVALAWIGISLTGALPFWLSREIPSFEDAFFEAVSGFTTTGSSILEDPESMSRGLLFWRSFTHWIGGMGVLVFVMAIMPLGGNRSMHLLRAESPGPDVGKLAPKMRSTAMILYGIYILITALQTILLLLGGMPLYDSLITTFGTVGTGGFSCKTASIAAYDSAYVDGVVTVFMIMCGVNFNLYYQLLMRQTKPLLKSEELRCYLGIQLVSMLVITVNILPQYTSFGQAFRHASFQVASINSTTGFATADFNAWPELSKCVLVLLMLCGSMAGSTGGGIKTVRIIMAFKGVGREIRRMLHTRSVSALRVEGKPIHEETVVGVNLFLILYAVIICASTLLISADGFDFATNLTAAIATISNIGPGLSSVGPTGNFAHFSAFSKLVLSANMLIGRLEIFPLIILFTPTVWKR